MIVLKPSPKGIDITIQRVQEYIYQGLKTKWAVTDANYNCFGRAYRNQTTNGYNCEVYNGANEYTDSYFDDTLSASSFFGVGETIKVTNRIPLANCFLIVMVDLSRIKSGQTRNDEEVRIDVQKLLNNCGVEITGYLTGITNVFKEYTIDLIKFRDMHPLHCFRINFDFVYSINQSQC